LTEPGREAVQSLEQAVRKLEACSDFVRLVPEVRVNLVCLPAGAALPDQVLGVDGRITVVGAMPKASGPIRAGVSDHMARLIIELRKHDKSIRAGLDFRWNESIMAFVESYCREHDIPLGRIDRTIEPKELIGKDKGSIPWKVQYLVETCGKVPPLFFESRGWGKEPLFFLVGPDPDWVVERACAIARSYAKSTR